MRELRPLLTGVLFLLWMNFAASEWPYNYFLESSSTHPNATFSSAYQADASARIWEGTTSPAELMRLSYTGNGPFVITYSGAVGLGLEVVKDTHPEHPYYLQTSEPGDYDSGTKIYSIRVSAQDITEPGYVIVQVDNVNDNPPIIRSPASCFVKERYTGETDCEFVVEDVDTGACFAKMSVDDDHFAFKLKGPQISGCEIGTFVLEVIKELDFEQFRLHSIKITAVDSGQTSAQNVLPGNFEQTTTVSFVVNVDDVPDEAPLWQEFYPSVTVDEKKPWTRQLKAVDGDFGLNWDIEYSLDFPDLNPEFQQYFKIDPVEGVLEGLFLDRDELKQEIYKMKVVATEVIPDDFPEDEYPDFNLPLSIESDLVVMVNDINDNWPKIVPDRSSLKVNEETAFSCKDFSVIDPDLGENGSFDLELGDSEWTHNFILIPQSGYQEAQLTLTPENPSLLDYEDHMWRVIVLQIVATEVKDPSRTFTAEYEINLIDINDEYPVFEKEEYSEKVEENTPANEIVIQVHATDPDFDFTDVITYSMRNSYLDIDEEDGIIRVANDNAFDYERQTEVILQVTARDQVNHTSFCQVTISVIDLNDEPPTLMMPSLRTKVYEHDPVGTRASEDITATDPDAMADLTFDIDWGRSTAHKRGVEVAIEKFKNSVNLAELTFDKDKRIWTTYVEVTNETTFDWEVFDTMRLMIVVTDETTLLPQYEHNHKRDSLLTVDVEDINDCPPVFTDESMKAELSVYENQTIIRLVGFMIAEDEDGVGNNVITYSIEPAFPEGLTLVKPQIRIDPKSGQMYTMSDSIIDAEEFREEVYTFMVTASDTVHNTTELKEIIIIDINDCYPEVHPDHLIIDTSIREHEDGPREIACIEAKDDDVTVKYHTIYYVLPDGDANYRFVMDDNCLWVKHGDLLDREDVDFHRITVIPRDNYEDKINYDSNEGPWVTINLEIEDINDNEPIFANIVPDPVYEDKTKANALLFSVEVTDDDIGINKEIQCIPDPIEVTMETPNRPDPRDGLFRVETDVKGSRCLVYTNYDLLYLWGEYKLVLKVTDKGVYPGPLSSTGTFTLTVINGNLHYPQITYPTAGVTIRLGRDLPTGGSNPLKDLYGEDVPDFTATDEDDPKSPNGQVSLELKNGDNIFGLSPLEDNTYRLRMMSLPPSNKREFKVTLTPTDKAEHEPKTGEPVEFNIYVIELYTTPTFLEESTNVSFSENTEGLKESAVLPEAINENEILLPESERREIWYYLIEGDVNVFDLVPTTGLLTLKKELDYDVEKYHELKVLASHEREHPGPGTYYGTAVLDVLVEVIDINDKPPSFVQHSFLGTFRADSPEGFEVLQLNAIDPDTDDEVTYLMKENSIRTDSESLKPFVKEDTFLVDSETGVVTLNFSPNNRELYGHFTFDVIAHDTAGMVDGHTDEAVVHVYVVSVAHQVLFQFSNRIDMVEEKKDEMADVFSKVFQYSCSVDGFTHFENNVGVAATEVQTHFIDEEENEPVRREIIENDFAQQETYSALYSAMQDLSLSFSGYGLQTVPLEARSYMTIVLAAVCAVLAVLVVVFSLAFVVRTRTLNQRLDKLTSKKFGSQDSGLNRESLTVPGTNRHAMEGSNPVWNREIDDDYDNISQESGDSDLIGIEDSPEFGGSGGGVDNKGFQRRDTAYPINESSDTLPTYEEMADLPPGGLRRASINPLAAAAKAEETSMSDGAFTFSEPDPVTLEDLGMPRRMSLNPLASGINGALDGDLDSVEFDPDALPSNSNFSFQGPDRSTEL